MNKIKTMVDEMQAALRDDARLAKAKFQSASCLQKGFESHARMREHKVVVDEPPALGGTDRGPNPVELVLAALGTCQEIAYRVHAAALDIPLDGVRVDLTGNLDLRGFFAVDDAVRPGYSAIRGTVHLDTVAAPADVERLRRVVDAHCPVLDIVSKPVPVELTVTAAPQRAAATV